MGKLQPFTMFHPIFPKRSISKFFTMSMEFDKNIFDCTDPKNGIEFFMRLVKWPKMIVKKKPIFIEILGTKVVWFWCYTKVVETKNMLLNWFSSEKKIRKIFFASWCWKLTLKIRFWHFLTAIYGHLTSLTKKSMPFLWSVQSWL